MSPRGLRPLLAVTALLAALVFSGTGQAKTSCVSAVINDWRDGRIDGTHSVACYQTALAQLPEDLRIYSSAESDIKRALLSRTQVALAAPAKELKSRLDRTAAATACRHSWCWRSRARSSR